MIAVGDVLRVTKAVAGAGERNLLGRRVGWAIATTSSRHDEVSVDWLSHRDVRGVRDTCPYLTSAWDTFEVVPGDKVPNKISVLIMQRALLGDDDYDYT